MAEIHTIYVRYLQSLVNSATKQLGAHNLFTESFNDVYDSLYPLTAEVDEITSFRERRKSRFWLLKWLDWLLEWFLPSSGPNRNKSNQKTTNLKLLKTYLDQAAPKLADAKQELEETLNALTVLLNSGLTKKKEMTSTEFSTVDIQALESFDIKTARIRKTLDFITITPVYAPTTQATTSATPRQALERRISHFIRVYSHPERKKNGGEADLDFS
ncbi:MAG: hypothetical protein FRX48_02017 [Lasallia pustulata]|uniref:Uncharacterized protein n=1 Tax=Lasallia pustulata TaxID=136370 RepID=A0A5M8PX60_9LECA|nr:MAG: hypothetical protein FRX48_02017 [Lasallia pustulata]